MCTSEALESQLENSSCSKIAHLLYRLAIGKDFIDNHIELTEVVLPKPVSIPTDGFQQNALKAIYWQVEGDIPFWIEVLADGRSGLFRVSKGYNQILLSSAETVCFKFLMHHRHLRDHWCHFCLLLQDF